MRSRFLRRRSVASRSLREKIQRVTSMRYDPIASRPVSRFSPRTAGFPPAAPRDQAIERLVPDNFGQSINGHWADPLARGIRASVPSGSRALVRSRISKFLEKGPRASLLVRERVPRTFDTGVARGQAFIEPTNQALLSTRVRKFILLHFSGYSIQSFLSQVCL